VKSKEGRAFLIGGMRRHCPEMRDRLVKAVTPVRVKALLTALKVDIPARAPGVSDPQRSMDLRILAFEHLAQLEGRAAVGSSADEPRVTVRKGRRAVVLPKGRGQDYFVRHDSLRQLLWRFFLLPPTKSMSIDERAVPHGCGTNQMRWPHPQRRAPGTWSRQPPATPERRGALTPLCAHVRAASPAQRRGHTRNNPCRRRECPQQGWPTTGRCQRPQRAPQKTTRASEPPRHARPIATPQPRHPPLRRGDSGRPSHKRTPAQRPSRARARADFS
jgi:hypothetical protein